MKYKYQRLSKEEKKEVQKNFYQTKIGKTNRKRLIRVIVSGLILTIYSIYLFIDNYLNINSVWITVLCFLILITGIVFIIKSVQIRTVLLNNYAIGKYPKD